MVSVLCSLTRFQIGHRCHREEVLINYAINKIRPHGLGPGPGHPYFYTAESFVFPPLPKTLPTLPYSIHCYVPEISVKIEL